MLKQHTYYWFSAIWIVFTLGVWTTLVPGSISISTLGWLNVAVLTLFAVMAMVVRGGTPTRSIAHVLYEAEHPTKAGR